MKELERTGLYDNSVILVTTDNGGGSEMSNRYLYNVYLDNPVLSYIDRQISNG